MKKQPKPSQIDLTAKGQPRQRAPGAGRPVANRKTRLSLVSETCRQQIKTIASHWECTQAQAIESMTAHTHAKLKP